MSKGHTAVVYFHGIGNPRRHVSLSKFLDYFDLFGQAQDSRGIGRPRTFQHGAKIAESGDLINYVEFKRIRQINGKPVPTKVIRVYEAYWVPEAASRFSDAHLILWILLRTLNPLRLAFSRWRSYPSLKLNYLYEIDEVSPKLKVHQKVERLYRDFENWAGRSLYRRGSFRQFLTYISGHIRDQGEASEICAAATQWRHKVIWDNLKLSFKVFTMIALLVGFSAATVLSAKLIYAWWQGSMLSTMTLGVASTTCFIILCIVVFGYPRLRNYVFDVLAWTLQSEKDERYAARRKVVDYAVGLLRDVLTDPECTKCVIVSHSLGSCIAYEALMREGALVKARIDERESAGGYLSKLTSIFTIGSPLDWIYYLFQTDRTFSHRYHRVSEDQRPSLTTPPFWFGGRAGRTKIINIWSRFDPISSKVYSPRKSVSERRDALLNIEAFPSGMPLPMASHTSYFADRSVMKLIYWAVMADALPDRTDIGGRTGRVHTWLGPWIIFLCGAAILGLLFTALVEPASAWLAIGSALVLGAAAVSVRLARRHYQGQRGTFLRR